MNIGHFSRRNQDSIGKDIRLLVKGKLELGEMIVFFMRGEDNNFELIEDLDPFLITKDLALESIEHLVRRIILYPNEGMRDIN